MNERICYCVDDFKNKISEKDAYISKLLKEKSQQQERITSQEEQSIKETSSVEVQFNYLIPSMGKRYVIACLFELILIKIDFYEFFSKSYTWS